MDIKETTPPRKERTFSLEVTQSEMAEISIAFAYTLGQYPQWYTNIQQDKVTAMYDKIKQMLLTRQ